ncbi:MAG: NHL repeat-containing protein [Phycisphaerales bacterium]
MSFAAFACILALEQAKVAEPACAVYGKFARQLDGLERPMSVAVARDGRVAVVEADARRVRVFDARGEETLRIGDGAHELPWSLIAADAPADPGATPRAVAFDAADRLTIAAPGRIATFAKDGDPWRWWSGLATLDPVAIAWRGDELLVADRTLGVVAFSADGVERGRFRGPLRRPAGIAVAPSGDAFVSDEDLHAVVRFAPDGTVTTRFGERGAFPGLLDAPAGLAIGGDCVYVADELNHRIELFSFDGQPRGQWGMHAVVPREGQGKIHYPIAVAIAPDATSAIVAEPFERRVQWFAPSDSSTPPSTMPALSGVESHFGPGVAADADLLLLHEPETASAFVFDLRGATPVHVSTFGGAGESIDRFNRIVGLGVDAASQRVVVLDAGARRIAAYALARDRAESLKLDPLMARLARAWSFDAWSDAVRAAARGVDAGAERVACEPAAIVKAPSATTGKAPNGAQSGWWIYDARGGLVVRTDATLAPLEVIATGVRGGTGLALTGDGFAIAVPDAREVVLLDATGAVRERWRGPGDAPFVRPTSVAACASGDLAVTDSGADRVVLRGARQATAPRVVGERGISDKEFWLPEGVAALDGGRFVVVDRGNHRAQIFTDGGAWVMTFGLGRAYTTPRERGAS